MKTKIAVLGFCVVFCGNVLSQTNAVHAMSETLDAVRKKYPQYKDVPDDVLIKAIGDKYPVYLKKDKVFADEYAKIVGTNLVAQKKPWELYQKTNAQNIIVGTPPAVSMSLTLSNGVVLEIIKIDSIDPDGLNVSYLHRGSSSLDPSYKGFVDHVKIPFEILSKEIQEKYNYNPAAAATHREQLVEQAAARTAANAAYQKQLDEYNQEVAAQEAERQKEEVDLEIKIKELQALQDQADAEQRQADAEERAADAQEEQSLKQQQLNSQLDDLNWQLMQLRYGN